VKEIYVRTSEERGREQFHVQDYEAPTENFIDLDTTNDSPEGSLVYLINQLSL
jgi:hypothetical protein